MEHLGFLVFVVLVLVLVVTGAMLLAELLARPDTLVQHVFPAHRPRVHLFGPRDDAASNALVVYFASRAFVISLAGLLIVWLWGYFTRAT
jgi:hypothetical protein